MASSSRDSSRDRTDSLKHQHSFSDSGRSSVPMWDSSDPERAPPPLPLNPGSASGPSTRPNTSARIEEAAALITGRNRENAPSAYTSNQTSLPSPDKSLIKPQHRRMQSIQGNVRGLSDSLERRSPDKGLRTSKLSEYEEYRSRTPDRSPTRAASETPTPNGKVTPSHLNRPTLSENTPPSATMLALQSMRNRAESETPLANTTNNTTAMVRTPQTFDAISAQILSLTSIATNLQREMAQLSRRSKDNATDLISLKEATNSRDEDIRKSLRDLVTGLDGNFSSLKEASRSTSNLGLYLDNKAHNGSPGTKNFTLPRIPSPSSFASAIDRDITTSPSLVSSDGAATIALLEKVLREMGTKDSQNQLLKAINSIKSQSRKDEVAIDPKVILKLEEVLSAVKDSANSRALVPSKTGGASGIPSQVDLYFDEPVRGPVARSSQDLATAGPKSQGPAAQTSDFVNNEIMQILKRIKQSISEGGGLTNEVKALVRELRGEVLGMGREIARKLEQAESDRQSISEDTRGPSREEITHIVERGLSELKDHMHHLVRENRRQSAASAKSAVNTQEVIHAVRGALAELPMPREEVPRNADLEREQLIVAVREAWEDCKPEIALEHFGLERDEILATLKEGLKSYQPAQTSARDVGITYEEVLDAVRKGMANFKPPAIETEASITREEILMAVRECLESFDFPAAGYSSTATREIELTRDDIVGAVREGLLDQAPISKEIEFNRDDLYDAVSKSLEGARNPMLEFLDTMKTEFKQYSAANGKDTEQVLDAMKDGFEELRGDIESYVDRASDVTNKDEIIDVVKDGFRTLQVDLEKGFANGHRSRDAVNTPELLDALEKEFEHLRGSLSKALVRGSGSSDKEEILDAIRDIADNDRSSRLSSNSEGIVRLVKDELEHMRTTLAGTLVRGGSSLEKEEILETIREGVDASRNPRRADGGESILSNTSELLDAFQDGVDGIRADMQKLMDRPVDLSTSYEILDTLKAGIESIRNDVEKLQETQKDMSDTATARGREVQVHDPNLISTEIEGLKVMITQLRIKVEALDNMPPPVPSVHFDDRHVQKVDLNELHTAIKAVHQSVNNFSARGVRLDENAATKDDTDAIETLLRNVKAKLDDFSLPDAELLAKTEHIEALEDMIKDMRDAVEESTVQFEKHAVSKEDFTLVELLMKEVAAGVEELQGKVKALDLGEERITKADLQAVEAICIDTKTQIDELLLPDPKILSTKNDIATLQDTIKAFQEQVEAEAELSAQAFEARKTEHGGLATKIDDVQGILSDIRAELVEKLDGSQEGIHELAKVLEDHCESLSAYATASSISDLAELVNKEFDRHLEHHVTTKLEAEDRDAATCAKHETLSHELKLKIEDKFNELMTKYDDAQISNDHKLKTLEARDGEHLKATTDTRAIADDLKLLIEALGTTVTESVDRMSDDAKTVFNRVDEANGKIDNLHSVVVAEHGMTREEVVKTYSAAARLETSIGHHHPAMMAAIQEVLSIVGRHYEHSQQQAEHQARYAEDHTRQAEEIMSGMSAIPSAIPPLLPALPAEPAPVPLTREIPVHKEYDDSQVHDKLNVLIGHAAGAKEAFSKIEAHHASAKESLGHMDKLDKIHEQMIATASEVSAMVATQTRLMSEHHASRATEAAEAGVALEKRIAQKEKVEGDIVALNDERVTLMKAVEALRQEREELAGQTKRMSREVAKLETALNIRQEEMRDMDARAERLERRILEGVMDHARSRAIPKPTPGQKTTAAERDAAMSLKRVPSSTSTITTKTSVRDGNSTLASAVGMALKKRSPLGSATNSTASSRSSGIDRRILSTSHVIGNRGRELPDRALMLAPVASTGLVSLKRSHSVKSNPSSYYGARKASWNGTGNEISVHVADKENHVLSEEDEQDSDGDETSDAGTERRSSFSGTSLMYTDSLAYGTGSSLSTNGARTASYASSTAGAIGGNTESIAEEDESEGHGHDEQLVDNHGDDPGQDEASVHDAEQENESAQIMALLESPPMTVEAGTDNSMALTTMEGLDDLSELQPPKLITGDLVQYHHGSDSGLGTEPATVDGDHLGLAQEYFQMTRQDLEAGR